MRSIFILLAVFAFNASAGFEKIKIENLDFDYAAPHGSGTVEKVGIGVSLAPETFPIEITRTENSFELISPNVDFTWYRPLKFIYNIEKLAARKTNAGLGTKTHFVESDYLMFQPKGQGEFKAEKLNFSCAGDTAGEFEVRLMDDCRTKLDLTIKRIDIPVDNIFLRIFETLPPMPMPEDEFPGDNVVASIRNGDFALQVYIKYWVYAGIRAWGHVQYENDHKVIAARVDQIKFGYFNVTSFVMKKLKELVKSPDVKIDPPWIRINIEKIHDTQSK